MRDWLRDALESHRPDIAEAHLFGSVLDPARTPNDVDVVVVAIDGAGEPAWRRLRAVRTGLIDPFHAAFGLPLSCKILTPSEWREVDGVIVRKREPLW